MVLGGLMILAAMGLLLKNSMEDRKADSASQEVMTQMLSSFVLSPETTPEPIHPAASEEEDEEDVLTQWHRPLPKAMVTVMIDGFEYIGYLEIPALGLQVPVMSEWDETRLKLSPCRQYGTVDENTLVIAGHNYESHFGNLKNLIAGDLILFTDMQGNSIAYEVVQMEWLVKTQVEEMLDNPFDLTLYTCTPSGAERLTVRCCRA